MNFLYIWVFGRNKIRCDCVAGLFTAAALRRRSLGRMELIFFLLNSFSRWLFPNSPDIFIFFSTFHIASTFCINFSPAPPDIFKLHQLVQVSDFVIVTCAFSPELQHLFNSKAFEQMKRSSILINTSRGGIINQVRSMTSGHSFFQEIFEDKYFPRKTWCQR